jgi:hypothetical protein
MSYQNVKQKIKELEEKGYLNKGDNSVEYLTHSPNFIYRFFGDKTTKEGEKYFRQKLKEYLENEEVVFRLGYSLCIIPHKALVRKISEARSHTELANNLSKFEFIQVLNNKDDCTHFQFVGRNGQRFLFDASALQCALPDGITVENVEDSYRIKIVSDRCTGKTEKEEIDKLFE